MKKFGVRVMLIEDNSFGYIIRRLSSSVYEIETEDGKVLELAPEEFKEIENEAE